MGYLPPQKPTGFADYVAAFATLAAIYDVGGQFLSQSGHPVRVRSEAGYRKYIDDLYGHRPTDHFMALNYALLGCVFALAGTVALWWLS